MVPLLDYTFHWLISVIGQIIRLPPPIHGPLNVLCLLNEKGLASFFTASCDSPNPLASTEICAVFWVVMLPFLESERRRAIVIIVFPSPIASAKILKFTQSVNKMDRQFQPETVTVNRMVKTNVWNIKNILTPPLESCNVLGNSVVASPENTFKYKTSSLLK